MVFASVISCVIFPTCSGNHLCTKWLGGKKNYRTTPASSFYSLIWGTLQPLRSVCARSVSVALNLRKKNFKKTQPRLLDDLRELHTSVGRVVSHWRRVLAHFRAGPALPGKGLGSEPLHQNPLKLPMSTVCYSLRIGRKAIGRIRSAIASGFLLYNKVHLYPRCLFWVHLRVLQGTAPREKETDVKTCTLKFKERPNPNKESRTKVHGHKLTSE